MDTERSLAQNFAQQHPLDAALILEHLGSAEAAAYLDELPPRVAAEVINRMASSAAADCIGRLSPRRFGQIISALPLDGAAGILRRLEPEAQESLLKQAPPEVAAPLSRLLRYPENSAGALMDPRVLALPEDITVAEALARVRRAPRRVLYYLYVVDREQKLVGVLNLRELMLGAPKDHLTAVMRRDVWRLTALAGRAAIIDHPAWRDVHALPVVDDGGAFLGVMRYKTLRRLESETKSPPPAGGALSAALTLGELYWVGLAGVLTDLTTLAGSLPAGTAGAKESSNG